jgi:hypothetical protein
VARRGVTVEEKTVTIRCQRLTADKRYEEVDVEVPGNFFFGNGLAFWLALLSIIIKTAFKK